MVIHCQNEEKRKGLSLMLYARSAGLCIIRKSGVVSWIKTQHLREIEQEIFLKRVTDAHK